MPLDIKVGIKFKKITAQAIYNSKFKTVHCQHLRLNDRLK